MNLKQDLIIFIPKIFQLREHLHSVGCILNFFFQAKKCKKFGGRVYSFPREI